MFPPGHLAVSYLVAKPFFRNRPEVPELTSLTVGTLFPDISTAVLKLIDVVYIDSRWSHSPLVLLPLFALGIMACWTRVPRSRILVLFALGVASHLVVDILFDLPTLYFSDATNDVGGRWFYPWSPIIIEYRGSGLNIQPWELIMEGAFLVSVLFMWTKRVFGRTFERNHP